MARRNAELEAVISALQQAEADAAGGEAGEEGLVLYPPVESEAAGEGDLEDDFLLAALDGQLPPAGPVWEEGDEEEEEEEEEETDVSERSDLEDDEDWSDEEEAHQPPGGRRAPRELDDAFESIAAEYSDEEIGRANCSESVATERRPSHSLSPAS